MSLIHMANVPHRGETYDLCVKSVLCNGRPDTHISLDVVLTNVCRTRTPMTGCCVCCVETVQLRQVAGPFDDPSIGVQARLTPSSQVVVVADGPGEEAKKAVEAVRVGTVRTRAEMPLAEQRSRVAGAASVAGCRRWSRVLPPRRGCHGFRRRRDSVRSGARRVRGCRSAPPHRTPSSVCLQPRGGRSPGCGCRRRRMGQCPSSPCSRRR